MTNKKQNIAVLMGGPSAEHEVSLATGRVILGALDRSKYNVKPVTITKEGRWLLPLADPKLAGSSEDKNGPNPVSLESGSALDQLKSERGVDIVFIAMHGAYGEDGTVQGFLELAGIPYTGSGVLASALAMNKVKSAELFSFHGLKTPQHVSFSRRQWTTERGKIMQEIKDNLALAYVIKPSNCGSSMGITIVKQIDELDNAVQLALSYDDTALAQKYISGLEITCAVLDEGGEREPVALPPTQIIPKESEFFDYHAKYTAGMTEEITPPRLPAETIKEIQNAALKAHEVIGCAGMSRTDMIVSGNDIFVLETNTIPGMTETSLYPQAAAAVGISFPELLDRIIQAASRRR